MSANYPAINPSEQTGSHRTLGDPLDALLRVDQTALAIENARLYEKVRRHCTSWLSIVCTPPLSEMRKDSTESAEVRVSARAPKKGPVDGASA